MQDNDSSVMEPSTETSIPTTSAGVEDSRSVASSSASLPLPSSSPHQDGDGNGDDNDNDNDDNEKDIVEEEETTTKISKNQRRRLLRREKMLQRKVERKQQRKDQSRAIALAEGRDWEEERRKEAERASQGEGTKRQNELWQTVKLPLAKESFQIALDCSFENQMNEREISSLAQQLRYCYAYNKKATTPCLVGVTSLIEGSDTLTRLQKEMGFNEWGNRLFTCTSQSLEEYYVDNLSKIVYLTSDSETILNTLDDDKIYVIGGIVDRNRLKRVAMNRAEALGVSTAKLPLDDHLAQMASTPVLACNHVFNILIKTREYKNDWSKALEEILPTRKEPIFKKRKNPSDEDGVVVDGPEGDPPKEDDESQQP